MVRCAWCSTYTVRANMQSDLPQLWANATLQAILWPPTRGLVGSIRRASTCCAPRLRLQAGTAGVRFLCPY